MKKFSLVLLNLVLLITTGLSQENEKSNVSFGFNVGVGQNTNGYRFSSDANNFNYFEGDLHFTTGVNVSYFLTSRIRPRAEFRYSEMKYGMDWSDVYTDFDKTETKLNTLNLNLNLDFLLLNKNRFQLFVSPGIISEFIVGDVHRNYHVDGTSNMNNFSVLTDQYHDANAGANLSVIAKYKLNKNLGFTLTPGYNYYFKEFVSGNENKFTRKTINFGVEYTF